MKNEGCNSIDEVMQQLYDEGLDYLVSPTKENCVVYQRLMLQFLTKCFRDISPIVKDRFEQNIAEIEALDCSKVGENPNPDL